MNKKRLIAVLAAAVMLVSAMPVYAADPEVVTATGANVGEITGSSTVNDFSKDKVYKVTLPTSNSLNFIVDPQNLTALDDSESMEVDIATTGQGAIFSNGLATVKNEGNTPVIVKVSITPEVPDDVTLVSTQAEVLGEGGDKLMFLAAVPGTKEILFDAETGAANNYEATGLAVAIANESTPAELNFMLDKAVYVVTNNGGSFSYDIATGEGYADNYDAAGFKIGGVVDKSADWSEVSAAGLYINAVFELADVQDTEVATEGLYHVVDTTTTDYAPAVPAVTSNPLTVNKVSTTSFTFLDQDDAVIFNKTEGATITKVTINGTEFVSGKYTVNATSGLVTITQANMKAILGSVPASFTVVIETESAKYEATYSAE